VVLVWLLGQQQVTEGHTMTEPAVDVVTSADGSLVIRPHGVLGAEDAVELRHTLVHAVRRLRPLRLILDLRHVEDLDSINVGTLAAACQLGDDHQVAVFVDNSSRTIAGRLTAAGVADHRLRHVGPARAAA
jgi:anti-anti-sigma factor